MTVLRQLLMGGAAQQPPYLGLVATHGALPAGFSAPNTQAMTRSRHVCRSNVSSVQLIFGSWQSSEVTLGANATITASVEYPAGTFVQAKFSASTSGIIPDGSYIVSDPISVSLTKGDFFFVRSFYVNSAGFPFNQQLCSPSLGEACTFAASGLVDQTMGGAVTPTSGNIGYPCIGVIGQTTEASFLLLGDSRMYGQQDTLTAFSAEVGEVARSLGTSYAYCNAGIPGAVAQTLATAGATAKRAQLGVYFSHVVNQFGINDISAARTAAQLLADMRTIQSFYPGKRYYACTVAPRSTSTDSFATVVNQTTHAANPQRVSYNNTLRAGVAGFSGFLEIADPVESSRDSGLWVAPGFTPDGLHENQTANLAIVSSGNINSAAIARR